MINKEKTDGAGRRKMIFLILGILFLFYYFLCAKFGGFHLSMLFIWLAAGIACLLLAAVEHRFGGIPIPQGVRVGILCFFLAVLAAFAAAEGLIISGMRTRGPAGLDALIVLGAAVRGTKPTRALKHRIETAAEYLKKNPDTIAVLSGGRGRVENITEADCMIRELEKRGIQKTRLLAEDQSHDTEENIRNSCRMIPAGAKVGIVTNNFHVFRAVRIAKKMGYRQIYGIAAPYKSVLLPHYMIREFLSIVWELAFKRK